MSSKDRLVFRALRDIAPVRAAVRAGRNVLDRFHPFAWHLEGCARGGGSRLSIVFAGQLENKNYISHLAFAAPPTETRLGRRWFGSVLYDATVDGITQPDLRIAELDASQRRLLNGEFRFYLPCWIGGEIDLARAVQHIGRSKNAKEDLRRIRRDRMGYEIARGATAFEEFYSRMYKPYIATVYGERAFSMSREEMMQQLDRSELFLVTRGGEPVAGLIVIYDADRPRAWSLGVRDGDRALVKAGALRALDYLLVFYLAEKGYAKVHMGASRPFLKDGVLRHKKRIGLRICDSAMRGFAIQPATRSPGAQAFLIDNPFIFENDGVYVGAVFVDADSPPSTEQLRQLRSEYETAGLQSIMVLAAATCEEVGPPMRPAVSICDTSVIPGPQLNDGAQVA